MRGTAVTAQYTVAARFATLTAMCRCGASCTTRKRRARAAARLRASRGFCFCRQVVFTGLCRGRPRAHVPRRPALHLPTTSCDIVAAAVTAGAGAVAAAARPYLFRVLQLPRVPARTCLAAAAAAASAHKLQRSGCRRGGRRSCERVRGFTPHEEGEACRVGGWGLSAGRRWPRGCGVRLGCWWPSGVRAVRVRGRRLRRR